MKKTGSIICAIPTAVFFAVRMPASEPPNCVGPMTAASLLYLGAGTGIRKKNRNIYKEACAECLHSF